MVRVLCNGTTLVVEVSRDVFYSNLKTRLEPADENYYLGSCLGVPKANGGPYGNGKQFGGGSSDTNCDFGFPGEVTNVDLVFGITRKVFIGGTVWSTGD